MFNCPNCYSISTRVYNIKPTAKGIKRSRKCSDCGNNFHTIEIVLADNDSKADIRKLKSDIIAIFDDFISEKQET